MTMRFNGALPIVTIARVNSCVTRSASSRFTTKRAILPSYEFTPRGPQLGGLSCFLTRDQAPSRKCRAGRKHVLPSLFYGNSRTKFSRRLKLFVCPLRAPFGPLRTIGFDARFG